MLHFAHFGDEVRGLHQSAKGAQCNSLGQRPRYDGKREPVALKARNRSIPNISLIIFNSVPLEKLAILILKTDSSMMPCFQRSLVKRYTVPGAMPQAIAFRAVGAALIHLTLA